MFAFITENIFIGIFKYELGNSFFEDICDNLKLDKQKTDVIYFNVNFEKLENNFEVIENNLIIYDRPAIDPLKSIKVTYPGEIFISQGKIF